MAVFCNVSSKLLAKKIEKSYLLFALRQMMFKMNLGFCIVNNDVLWREFSISRLGL